VTRDEIANSQGPNLTLSVNGVIRQSGNTRNMIFVVADLASYISPFMLLHAVDLIATGTRVSAPGRNRSPFP
jgi:2-keto-4-pentenoate hydratase/2-oxohepta-3-ene-1,7-dioic acid hydratase in catechol pathway